MTKRKTETIEEFLARGGKITIIPPVKPEEGKNIIPTRTTIGHDLMSLGEGEFLFGETRAKTAPMKKRVNDDDFNKLLENSSLPASVIESLKKAIKNDG